MSWRQLSFCLKVPFRDQGLSQGLTGVARLYGGDCGRGFSRLRLGGLRVTNSNIFTLTCLLVSDGQCSQRLFRICSRARLFRRCYHRGASHSPRSCLCDACRYCRFSEVGKSPVDNAPCNARRASACVWHIYRLPRHLVRTFGDFETGACSCRPNPRFVGLSKIPVSFHQAAIGPMSIPALLIASGIASLTDPPTGQGYVDLVMTITFICGALSERAIFPRRIESLLDLPSGSLVVSVCAWCA